MQSSVGSEAMGRARSAALWRFRFDLRGQHAAHTDGTAVLELHRRRMRG
jgi:hypothetical protein